MPASPEEKTEPATPRRRREARRKGQVARSQDLTAAALLLAGFLALWFFGPGLWQTLIAITAAGMTLDGPIRMDDVVPFAVTATAESLKYVSVLLIVMFFAILAALYVQVGLLLTFEPLIPSLGRINPISGLKRLFSIRSIMLAVTNSGKLVVVALVAYLTLVSYAPAIIYAFTFGFREVFALGASLMFEMAMRLASALLILALLDVAWQRYRHARDLRMTKEEVKDEFRSMEGDPDIKRRRRDVQFRLALQRLHRDVPQADVIVTNPTHVSVAIAYDAEKMAAPRVVAKGADYVALRIRQIAQEFGIPIVQRPPLARALFESVDVGQCIPERLYRAIAEILAYVYELTGRSPRGVQAGAVA